MGVPVNKVHKPGRLWFTLFRVRFFRMAEGHLTKRAPREPGHPNSPTTTILQASRRGFAGAFLAQAHSRGHHQRLGGTAPGLVDSLSTKAGAAPEKISRTRLGSSINHSCHTERVPGPRDYSNSTRSALATLSKGRCYFPECSTSIITFVDDPVTSRGVV